MAEVDYDALYTASAESVRPKTAAELLEEKKRKRAAILSKHRQGIPNPSLKLKDRLHGTPPQPEEPPHSSGSRGDSFQSGITSSISISGSGTPAGLPAAVRSLRVEGTATPEVVGTDDTNRGFRDGTPTAEDTSMQHERDLIDLRQTGNLASREDGNDGPRKVTRPTDANDGEEISAADYNPDEDLIQEDMRERERLHLDASKTSLASHNQSDLQNRPIQQIVHLPAGEDANMLENDAEEEGDEGQEDEDDMFVVQKKKSRLNNLAAGLKGLGAGASGTGYGRDPDGPAKVAYVPVINRASDGALDSSTLIVDNFDDPEGYYRVILGELLDTGRYHVHANLGKGMFSNVIRAKDTADEKGKEVAIKIVRSQESM